MVSQSRSHMRVLYVGGTGEISYECVKQSVAIGQDVTVFNRGRSAEPLPDAVRQLTGDLSDDATYAKLAEERFDVVCQFIAFTPEDMRRDVEVFGGQCGQYMFNSTASAYHKPAETPWITEEIPMENPFWDYSQKKADMERYLLDQHAAGRINATIVRPSHTVRRNFP